MAIYPPGVQLAQLSIGPVTDMFGDMAQLTVSVSPVFTNGVTHITHTASGRSVAASTKQFISDSGTGVVTFAVPYTNETGWQDPSGRVIDVSTKPGWKYVLKVNATIGRQQVGSWTKEVQPLLEQTGEIDVDLVGGENILEGLLGPTAVVTSIAGKVGTVTVADLEAMGVGATGNLQIGTVLEGTETSATIRTDAEGNKFLDLIMVPGVGEKGDQGDPGPSAYQHWLNLGNTGTEADFLASLNGTDGTDGAAGQSAYALWLSLGNTGTEADFLQSLEGSDGVDGTDGADGRSAYQVWLDAGNTGTVSDYLLAIKGDKGDQGEIGPDGPMGSGLEITGSAATRADLDTLSPAPVKDDAYVVLDTGLLYIYDGATWSSGIPFKGDPGQDGADGTNGLDGKSAYQVWLDQGNTGTQAQFLASLEGADGTNGTNGTDGSDGASAYQIWLAAGNTGTEAQFLDSLRGADGTNGTNGSDGTDGQSAYQIWLAAGNTGTEADFLASLKGADGTNGTNGTDGTDGRSAYQIWLDAGNTGTEAVFLDSLRGTDGTNGTNGTDGADGDSAYQIWLAAGNSGTEADFLASLKGADGTNGTNGTDGTDGKSAYQSWLDAGNTGTEADFLASLEGADGQAMVNTPFNVRYLNGAWEYASLAECQTAGLLLEQTIWFTGSPGTEPPTWARTGDIWLGV